MNECLLAMRTYQTDLARQASSVPSPLLRYFLSIYKEEDCGCDFLASCLGKCDPSTTREEDFKRGAVRLEVGEKKTSTTLAVHQVRDSQEPVDALVS